MGGALTEIGLPIALGLVLLSALPWQLGIGMLLLAASPGGTTANLFSHLFRGDVALNITLTAIDSVSSRSGPRTCSTAPRSRSRPRSTRC
jgi:hypothetical protein